MRYVMIAMALLALYPVAASAAPIAPEDLYKLTLLSNAAISPDGAHVLVEAARINGPKDSSDRTISLVDVATGTVTENVTKHIGDGDYAWMPDSRSFVFVRTVEKQKPQLYRFTLGTGAIVALTHIKDGVSSPVVSHAGDRIALSVTETDAAPAAQIDFAKAGFTPKDAQKKSDIAIINQLFFQANGAGYTYRDHQHIWSVNADGSNAKQLTSGQYSEGFDAWSPDDRTILFDSLRYESVDSGVGDVYTMPSTGGAMAKVASPLPSNGGFFFGNDGRRVYFLSSNVTDSAARPALISANPDGSDRRIVVQQNTIGWGDSLLADMKEGGGLCGAPLPGTDAALLNVDGPGYANLRTLDLTNGTLTDVTPTHGEAWSCSVSLDGKRVAYLYSDFAHPADVFIANVGGGGAPRRLTNVNGAYLASRTLSVPQEMDVKDPAGFTVQAWFMPATTGTPGAKHPTLLDIHGGPETQFGDTFFHEFQLYTSMGYNVVFADPAGSTGHGYAFEEALEQNYGDAMFQDVQAVMDAAIQRPDVDSTRLGVLGGSYGGYATLWVIAHTNRYKVAVAERAVSNLQSENLAADFAGKNGLGGGYYTWGPPWDPASTDYAKFSPLTYVAAVQTPVLILHSDEDTRAPIDQTLQEYTSLKILGRTVEYVAVPNENHDLSRTGSPIHRVERLHLILDWLAKYLTPLS
ncbi:MAG TPA: S9 family peptidase [Candidatus Cybelea sp.]|jgi:dipeptidyl aminopeptidase/acylaminoacyl peptidase|nr:S9 family peptidase [Candidatus Cybelea sp.]